MRTTILEHYRAERAEARGSDTQRKDLRDAIWRTYVIALLEELAERQHPWEMRWKPKELDKLLPIRFQPAWRAMPIEELVELYMALERTGCNKTEEEWDALYDRMIAPPPERKPRKAPVRNPPPRKPRGKSQKSK